MKPPFFDQGQNQPYATFIQKRQFSDAINVGLALLDLRRRSKPTEYAADPKGTPFYILGIAAFASHDYQTATFLFDAAVSEDLRNYSGDPHKPALLFMRLDDTVPDQAARHVVDIIVAKLREAVNNYNNRPGSVALTDNNVRDHFLNHLSRPNLRTLTTTFVSFLAEWDYRLQMIDLSEAGSKEPFFTHLFRGCLADSP